MGTGINTLAAILDDSGARAEVQKWLVDSWLARQEWDYGMASLAFAESLAIPENKGQYLEVSRKGNFRRPQHVDQSNPTADPASGQTFAEEKVTMPIEFIHDWIGIGLIAGITSRHDLEMWAKEDLPLQIRRRAHELAQNALKVGRFKPGKWAADGTEAVSFDATAEATVTLNGVSFTFKQAKHSFAGGKPAFAALKPEDRPTMADFERIGVRLRMRGAPKINGRYVAFISEATKRELMRDKSYREAVLAWNGKGLAENQIADFAGFHWMEDDSPFTESWGNANVRATNGQVHTSFVFGKGGFATLKLGGKSPLRPTFKVQDTTITGLLKTIGYTVPIQQGVVNENWCETLTAPVSFYDPSNQ